MAENVFPESRVLPDSEIVKVDGQSYLKSWYWETIVSADLGDGAGKKNYGWFRTPGQAVSWADTNFPDGNYTLRLGPNFELRHITDW